MTRPIVIERHEAVALVRLDRPAARNAMNVDLASATVEAIDECQDAGAIVLTGTDPAFCAGLDLRSLGTDRLRDLPHFTAAVAASSVPVIGAVNGPAVTGGFELALACDFLIGSERARFADTHLRVGVYPGPVLVDLPRRVGPAWARQMSLTGNFVDAETALRIGILNEIVAHADLVPAALALAAAIAEVDRDMVRAMRAEWKRLDGLVDAHQVHTDYAQAAGFRDSSGEQLAERRTAVLARAHRQLGTAG
jgi:enoyl-CoA hydratase